VNRVQTVLEGDPAARRLLGPKTAPVRSRSGDVARFSAEALAIAQELMAYKLNPERAAVRQVLAVALRVLGASARRTQTMQEWSRR